MIMEIIVATLLLLGGFFCLVAGVGLLRFPDVLMRMHAGTKAGTLGVGLTLAALAVDAWSIESAARVVIAVAFLLLTAPVAAHMIGRAAYRSGAGLWEGTVVNELEMKTKDQLDTTEDKSAPDPEEIGVGSTPPIK